MRKRSALFHATGLALCSRRLWFTISRNCLAAWKRRHKTCKLPIRFKPLPNINGLRVFQNAEWVRSFSQIPLKCLTLHFLKMSIKQHSLPKQSIVHFSPVCFTNDIRPQKFIELTKWGVNELCYNTIYEATDSILTLVAWSKLLRYSKQNVLFFSHTVPLCDPLFAITFTGLHVETSWNAQTNAQTLVESSETMERGNHNDDDWGSQSWSGRSSPTCVGSPLNANAMERQCKLEQELLFPPPKVSPP